MNEFSEIDGPKNLYTAVAQIFGVTEQRLQAIDPAIIEARRFTDSDYRLKKLMLIMLSVAESRANGILRQLISLPTRCGKP